MNDQVFWMQYGKTRYELGSTSMPGVEPRDVANSLAKINRYTGHSSQPLSVARHSIFVSKLLDMNPRWALYGLVHDVAETVTNDLSWPLKQKLASADYKSIDHAAEVAIMDVLGIPMPSDYVKARVKEADWVAAATEKRDLLPPCDAEWNMLPFPASVTKAEPTKLWSDDAQAWMERYTMLMVMCGYAKEERDVMRNETRWFLNKPRMKSSMYPPMLRCP